jgi:urease accessory protein
MNRYLSHFALVSIAASFAATGTAFAHHAMDGEVPSTLMQGLISGLAHPVIGVDHLAFIIAVGVAAALAGVRLWMPILFVVASALGVVVHLMEFDLPAAELVIAASAVLVGFLLAAKLEVQPLVWAAIFAVAGLFHGYAYGEAIVGAEPTPIGAYLVGLIAIQSAIAIGAMLLMRHRHALTAAAVEPRLAGAFAFGVGLVALMDQVLPG